VGEVLDELRASLAFAGRAGVAMEQVLVDPGLGFGKDARHSYEALARLHEFSELGRPILVGPSRKSFLARTAGVGRVLPAGERDWATTAAIAASVSGGAHIVRVHAVPEMVQVVRVADEIRKYHREG
jgi:dihydropteroate synthase